MHVVERRLSGRTLLLAWGVIAVLAGTAMLVQPARTAALLLTIVALLWLVSGAFDLVVALQRHPSRDRLRLGRGVISVVAAVVVLLNLLIGGVLPETVQFWILIVAAAVNGASHLWAAVRQGGSRSGLTLGITQLAIAAALALSLQVTAALLFVVLGAELVVIGLVLLAVGWWLRSRGATGAAERGSR
jgi:uncharacterized membrane protein HdeD (DUF308 family)